MTPVPKHHVSHRGLTAWVAYNHDGAYQISSTDFSNNVVKVDIPVPLQGRGGRNRAFNIRWKSLDGSPISAFCELVIKPSKNDSDCDWKMKHIHRIMNKHDAKSQACQSIGQKNENKFAKRLVPFPTTGDQIKIGDKGQMLTDSDISLEFTKLASATLRVRNIKVDVTPALVGKLSRGLIGLSETDVKAYLYDGVTIFQFHFVREVLQLEAPRKENPLLGRKATLTSNTQEEDSENDSDASIVCLSGPSKPRSTLKSAQVQPALGVKRRTSDSSETIRVVRIKHEELSDENTRADINSSPLLIAPQTNAIKNDQILVLFHKKQELERKIAQYYLENPDELQRMKYDVHMLQQGMHQIRGAD